MVYLLVRQQRLNCPPAKQSADKFTKRGEQDWGGRYIDVDLTTQHARYGDDGTILWEADVLTVSQTDI